MSQSRNLKEEISKEVINLLKKKIDLVTEMSKKYPNDQEFGKQVRKLISNINEGKDIYSK